MAPGTGAVVPTGTSGAGPIAAAAPAPDPGPGNFQPPTSSSTWPVQAAGGSRVSATATWSGTPTLTLAVTCPGAHATRTGPSGLTVEAVAAASGVCHVSLVEPVALTTPVSYTLSIQPSPSA
ncbi:MAG: hypothetical protein ACRDY3_03360 [Acidimicrobiales bacterium]